MLMESIFFAVITPIVVQTLANKGLFRRYPFANAPIQTGLVGFILIFATPLGCAFFSQMASIKVGLASSPSNDNSSFQVFSHY